LVEVGIDVYVYTSMRPPYFYVIGSKTAEELRSASASVEALQTARN
jgi:hypothetical protein